MIKPNFTKASIIIDVQKEIMKLNLITKYNGFVNFSKEDAKNFYILKKDENYYDELVGYISSDKMYGFVVTGENAILKIKNLATNLRKTLALKYKLKTDVMKNVVHASYIKDGVKQIQNEIKIFLKNKR